MALRNINNAFHSNIRHKKKPNMIDTTHETKYQIENNTMTNDNNKT